MNVVAIATTTEYRLSLEYEAKGDIYKVMVNGTLYDNGGRGYKSTSGTDPSGIDTPAASGGVTPAGGGFV